MRVSLLGLVALWAAAEEEPVAAYSPPELIEGALFWEPFITDGARWVCAKQNDPAERPHPTPTAHAHRAVFSDCERPRVRRLRDDGAAKVSLASPPFSHWRDAG